MLPALVPKHPLPPALGLYVYYGLFLACLLVAVVAFWHIYTHTRASRPGDWEKAFSVYHHLLGWFDHGLCVSVHRSKRLPSDGEVVLLVIPVRHTLLEVYEPLGFLTGVRKEIPPAFRPSDVGAIEFRS